MDLLSFFDDHKRWFPTLWIVVQRNASRRVVEVGCERFFGLSGYISSPRRSLLGVRNYERLAMLACILWAVYIDPELVAKKIFSNVRLVHGRQKIQRMLLSAGTWSVFLMLNLMG